MLSMWNIALRQPPRGRITSYNVCYTKLLRITQAAQAEGRFESLGTGKEQYGHVELKVAPGEKGSGKIFESRVDEKQIPSLFIDAIKKGVLDSLDSGPIIGYPMLDVKVQLTGGSFDEEKSTEMAFGVAGTMACRKAVAAAGPVLMDRITSYNVCYTKLLRSTVHQPCIVSVCRPLRSC